MPHIYEGRRQCAKADSFSAELVGLERELRTRARALTQSEHAADDLVQDVFERALTSQDRSQSAPNLKGWLNVTMRNAFIDTYRRSRKEQPSDGEERAASEDQEPPGALDLLALRDVTEAMAGLEAAERELFALAYLDGWSYRAISARFGVTISTTGTRLLRIRGKLRKLLTPTLEKRRRAVAELVSSGGNGGQRYGGIRSA